MTKFALGVNTCFAVKRWPQAERWASLVQGEMGLGLVQHTLDLVQLDGPDALIAEQVQAIRDACAGHRLELHSTFTGLAAYSSNLLLDPDPKVRRWAEEWYSRAIRFTAAVGGRATGGHLGAFAVSDFRDPERRAELWSGFKESMRRLAAEARRAGLETLYVENLAAAREPSTMDMIDDLLTDGDEEHVPLALCLDVGHQVVPGTTGEERDPYAWLVRFGARSPVVQLQQSDEHADHHWPFTAETDVAGRIDPGRVLESLAASGAEEVALILEIIPAFEADDDQVLRDMVTSADRWRMALERFGTGG
jgi:sugar phosphate isomerase/epimerase